MCAGVNLEAYRAKAELPEDGAMDSEQLLRELVSRIRRAARPEKIVLFGSRARGEAREDSDFDLLLIKPSGRPRHERSRPIYAAVADIPAEVEVVVYTPQEVREWENVPQAFVTTALREGEVLYERKS